MENDIILYGQNNITDWFKHFAMGFLFDLLPKITMP